MALHDTKEFYNDFGWRSDEYLTLSTTFGIDNVVQAVVLRTKNERRVHLRMFRYLLGSQGQIREPFLFCRCSSWGTGWGDRREVSEIPEPRMSIVLLKARVKQAVNKFFFTLKEPWGTMMMKEDKVVFSHNLHLVSKKCGCFGCTVDTSHLGIYRLLFDSPSAPVSSIIIHYGTLDNQRCTTAC